MPKIAVALSGGGYRASLFGLGTLRYLVDMTDGVTGYTITGDNSVHEGEIESTTPLRSDFYVGRSDGGNKPVNSTRRLTS